MLKRLVVLLSSLLGFSLALAGPVAAQAPGWRVVETTGTVRVMRPGVAPVAGSVGLALPVGSVVTTGGASQAKLENGPQRIVLAANSRMAITEASSTGMTRILQSVGSALFEVDRQEKQHFRVETPLLAAVVKGTTFTVTAGPQEDVVHVARGLVEVRALSGDAVRDVPSGETARIARAAPSVFALTAPVADGASLSGSAAPTIDYAKVSDGVVTGPTPSGQPASQQNRAAASGNANQGRGVAGAADTAGVPPPAVGSAAAAAAKNNSGPPVTPPGPPVTPPGPPGTPPGPPVTPPTPPVTPPGPPVTPPTPPVTPPGPPVTPPGPPVTPPGPPGPPAGP